MGDLSHQQPPLREFSVDLGETPKTRSHSAELGSEYGESDLSGPAVRFSGVENPRGARSAAGHHESAAPPTAAEMAALLQGMQSIQAQMGDMQLQIASLRSAAPVGAVPAPAAPAPGGTVPPNPAANTAPGAATTAATRQRADAARQPAGATRQPADEETEEGSEGEGETFRDPGAEEDAAEGVLGLDGRYKPTSRVLYHLCSIPADMYGSANTFAVRRCVRMATTLASLLQQSITPQQAVNELAQELSHQLLILQTSHEDGTAVAAKTAALLDSRYVVNPVVSGARALLAQARAMAKSERPAAASGDMSADRGRRAGKPSAAKTRPPAPCYNCGGDHFNRECPNRKADAGGAGGTH
jgi:hypothetical protein